MTVTTRHPQSQYGLPVVLDEEGRVLETHLALGFFRRFHGLSLLEFGRMCNVTETRVRNWETGRVAVPANVLNVVRDYLEEEKERVMRGGLRMINGELRAGFDLVRKRIYASNAAGRVDPSLL